MSGPGAKWFRLVVVLGVVLVCALGGARAVRAVEFDDDGVIAADEVIDDDVFISAEHVVIDGTVNGDLFASGDRVTVNGTVNGNLIVSGSIVVIDGAVDGSLILAGQDASVNGPVSGSVYAAGIAVSLGPDARVGRNMFWFGFSLNAQAGSLVRRDLLITAYQAALSGQVDRDVSGDLDALDLDGSVGGDVTVTVGAPENGGGQPPAFFPMPGVTTMAPAGLRVAEGAEIGGRLTYKSPVEQGQTIQARPGEGVDFQRTVVEDPQAAAQVSAEVKAAQWILNWLREMVTLVVLGALAGWLVPALLSRASDQMRSRPLHSAGWGLLVAVTGFVGAAMLAVIILVVGVLFGIVTLGGLANVVIGVGFSGLGLAFTLFMLAVTYGSKLVVAYLVGKLLLGKLVPQANPSHFMMLLVGVLIYMLFRLVPVVGWLVGFAVTLFGLGALWLALRRPPAAPAVVPAVELPATP